MPLRHADTPRHEAYYAILTPIDAFAAMPRLRCHAADGMRQRRYFAATLRHYDAIAAAMLP